MSDQANRRAALMVAVGGSFLNPFMGSSINIALPVIGREFAMDAVLLGWVATAFLLMAAMCLLPFGRLADIRGRKRVYAWGVAIYTLCSAVCALAPSSGWLIAGRALQGLGSAMMFGTGMAILTSVFPPEERGRVLGINVAAVYLGLSLGPVVGGMLTQHLGWRSVFWINVPLGLAILACVFWKLEGEWAGARGERFDLGGTLLYGLSLVALLYGGSRLPSPAGVWPVALGVLGLIGFVLWEQRVGFPLLNIGLFRNNLAFAFSNLAALINYSATSAVGFLLSLYLQYLRGLSPQSAGLVMVAQPLVMAACSPLAGRLSDRVEPRTVASVGMGLTVTGLGLLTALDAQTSWAYLVAVLLILGLGFALFSSPNANAVMSSVAPRFYGVASAALGTMRLTGNMLSMGVAMAILGASMGRVQIAPEHQERFLDSLHLICTLFALLCLGGIFASLARGKIR